MPAVARDGGHAATSPDTLIVSLRVSIVAQRERRQRARLVFRGRVRRTAFIGRRSGAMIDAPAKLVDGGLGLSLGRQDDDVAPLTRCEWREDESEDDKPEVRGTTCHGEGSFRVPSPYVGSPAGVAAKSKLTPSPTSVSQRGSAEPSPRSSS